MANQHQHRPKHGRRSPRELSARLLALFCVLLVAIAGTAQAVHFHGSYASDRHTLATQHDASSPSGDESVCPLCVAMHSALPTSVSLSTASGVLHTASAPAQRIVFVREPAHFAAFSRPPPALLR